MFYLIHNKNNKITNIFKNDNDIRDLIGYKSSDDDDDDFINKLLNIEVKNKKVKDE